MKPLYKKELVSFPHPALAFDEGIVDLSDDLSVDRLLESYSFGIFPWPHEDLPTLWFSPAHRGVLDFSEFHISKSLKKVLAKSDWSYSFNREFETVIRTCAQAPRPGQSGTWITERMIQGYLEFHDAGYAHSLEVWAGDDLVGGLYGVYVAGVFSGESMFFHQPNASKAALVRLVDFLSGHNLTWMDIQMVTPASKAFGGKYIPRHRFLERLDKAKRQAMPIEFKI